MASNRDTNTRLHYDLNLWVNPLTQQMTLSGSLVYHAPPQGAGQARFYLDHRFNIHSIEGRRVSGYQFETRANDAPPGAGILDIHFDPPLAGNHATLVRFEFEGRLDQLFEHANREWVELSLPLIWYPLPETSLGAPAKDGLSAGLTFTLQVTCPAGYAAASLGGAARKEDAWQFDWPHPTDDIVVAAARRLNARTFESESNKVHLYSFSFSATSAGLLGEDLLWALERFSGWFGPVRPAEFTILQTPRAQGYTRRGLAALPAMAEADYLAQREAYLHHLAHEAAHTWWWAAPNASWEDWLNESFAEYSALMAIRERYGLEAYQRRLEDKRRQVARLAADQALWGFDRSDTSSPEKLAVAHTQLYDRGPLLLHELAARVGYRRFLDLCRGMQWAEVHSTDHFLDLLEELEDRETRAWMEEQLKHAR